jgi:hypothetical protein
MALAALCSRSRDWREREPRAPRDRCSGLEGLVVGGRSRRQPGILSNRGGRHRVRVGHEPPSVYTFNGPWDPRCWSSRGDRTRRSSGAVMKISCPSEARDRRRRDLALDRGRVRSRGICRASVSERMPTMRPEEPVRGRCTESPYPIGGKARAGSPGSKRGRSWAILKPWSSAKWRTFPWAAVHGRRAWSRTLGLVDPHRP